MTSFRILSEASEELRACVSYYNSQQLNLGTEFLAEFQRSAERILKLPNAARMVSEDVRSKPIHRFPFYILYRSLEDEITIVAVAHRRRRPRYWLDRTQPIAILLNPRPTQIRILPPGVFVSVQSLRNNIRLEPKLLFASGRTRRKLE